MAGNLYPVSGSKMYIGNRVTAKGKVTTADFAAAVWTEVGGWTQAGALGDSQELISQSVISEGRMRKIKGLLDGGNMENTFLPSPDDAGQAKFKAAIKDPRPYQFKIVWAGSDDEAVVTITAATPHVVTWTAHGLVAGQGVTFESTGALPGTLQAGQTYYVLSTGLTADSFQIGATAGGPAIGGTGAGTGTIVGRALEVGQTDMFYGLALPGPRQGGEGNTAQLRSWTVAVDSNIVEV